MLSNKGFVREITLPQIHDPRGDLTFVEGGNHIPFEIRRVYYLFVFALSGSFRLKIDDGASKSEYWLRDPRKGLYISRVVWREMDSFSQGAVCMVLASHAYDETDYYRNYNEFVKALEKETT